MKTQPDNETIMKRNKKRAFKQLSRRERACRYHILQQTGEHEILQNVAAATQLHAGAAI